MNSADRPKIDRPMQTRSVDPRRSDSRLANDIARLVWTQYSDLWDLFHEITSRAPTRFREADWVGAEADTDQRLRAYIDRAALTSELVHDACGDRLNSVALWTGVKAVFTGLIDDIAFPELAETFFNSITRKVFTTEGVNQQIEFVSSDVSTFVPSKPRTGVVRTSVVTSSPSETMLEILCDAFRDVPWVDAASDAQIAANRISESLGSVSSLETLTSVFYRGRGAYLLGKARHGDEETPFALSLLHSEEGVQLDAVLTTEAELSILFSFAHSYFHAIIDHPSSVAGFLIDLMPKKRLGELYASLGYHKHGKTDLFRSIMGHLDRSPDRFEISEGVEGLVMSVFTLPGFGVVFKVIKDSFPPTKHVTRSDVKSAYELVFNHDRVGRLVETYEFEHLTFPTERFDQALLDHLAKNCSRAVSIGPKEVTIGHVYIERKVIPLNLFLQRADTEASVGAVIEYGQAIKDLMAAGIFPGDMLLKNFGVTRHGRVVFYDYDEVQPISECNFRKIPVAAHADDEMSATPWFSTGPGDVFPEEFINFLGLKPALRKVFVDVHGDIFTKELWQHAQSSMTSDDRIQIFPYDKKARVRRS